jgi:hypothetical protein
MPPPEHHVRKVLNSLAETVACRVCGTRVRLGDLECSHCGVDLEEDLREWASRLLDTLATDST